MSTSYTVSNIAGGDLRRFRLVRGKISDASIRHARRIGFGGPTFGGYAGDIANEQYQQLDGDR